ncbi:FRG domain-containing protein [Lysinibacillus sp. FSL K6-0232]|uniref:FRG domain-containing protein n=1 Tax=Lysinibacillus sp. FSL K6-0232 TaxID=2921425 RepID=UPI0030FC56B3
MSITLSSNSEKKLFRGQSNDEWDLEPSIIRGKKMPNKEAAMYLEIQQANHKEFIDDDFINNACNMQHYGIPTRLLDWTENSLHALYFACVSENWIGVPGKIYYIKSPEVININSKENEIIEHFLRYKYLSCEKVKVSVINHLKKMAYSNSKRYTFFKTKYYNERIKSQQGCFSVYFEQTEEEAGIVRELLLEEIKSEYLNAELYKGEIERTILNSISDKISEVVKNKKFDSYYISEAMEAINALLDLQNPIEKRLAEELIEKLKMLSKVVEKKHCMDDIVTHENQLQIIIKPELKEVLIKQLENMGINSRTVYPDIQGLASYLKEHY